MAMVTVFDAIMDWWLMLWVIYVIYSLLLFIYGALRGWVKFLWLLVGLGLYPLLLAYVRFFQSPLVQLAYMVVVAVVLYIMSTESDFAFPLLVLFVIHSVLFVYVRAFRETIILELTTLVVAIVAQLAKIAVKIVRHRSPPSSSSYVDGASGGPLQQPLPSFSSYVEMGVFSYRYDQQEEEECVICLCEYQEEDALVALPSCQHSFHVDCIRRWLKCQLRCPICNAYPFKELESHAEKDFAVHLPLPPVLAAGNMREESRESEGNV